MANSVSIDDAWRGFRLVKSTLWTPENFGVRPGDIRAIPYRHHELLELKRALATPQQNNLF